MIKKYHFLFSITLLVIGCNQKKQLPIIQKINTDWKFTSQHDNNWRSATVPGNIFTDLLDHKLIDDPFILNNEEKVQWVSDSTWIYKTTFKLDEKVQQKKHIDLNFEGLDTYAKVFLNSKLILSSNNAFRQYSVPIKSFLKEENELKIIFESTSITEEKEKQKLTYQLPEGNRIFTRKAQFQYGWDWGPKLNTSGIWKNISVKAWNDTTITDVYIQDKEHDLGISSNAYITIQSDIQRNAIIYFYYENAEFRTKIDLQIGTHTYKANALLFKPKLWWPHNIGEPHLYDFNIQLVIDETVLDEKNIKHGVRTIELVTDKDSIGQSFYFKVNGIPIYAKGANYIPQNSFQNKVSKDHYKKLLNNVVDANMNMLRVWGGGIYENDTFYELCDEKGILVWQDFMFACAMYPGDDAFLKNIQQEAIDQVKRLRNHVSIALWAGNNENSEGWHRWGWQSGRSEKEKKEIWDNYLKVFDSILPNTVKELTTTSYWESSPKYGRGNPKYTTEGDAHDWWVWHDGYPFEHFEENVPRFMSEFGFQSFPSYEAINYINQKDKVDIDTDAIKSHQKHSRGFQLIDEYMKRDYPIPNSDEDYVYVSQLVQAKGITMGIEAQRKAKPYNMGSLYWQLNDCWPVISWSSIDYFGNWKALHYKAKKSFQDVLISSHLKENKISTYIINDKLGIYKDTLHLKIIDFSGKELWSHKKKITVGQNTSAKVFEFSLDSLQIDTKNTVLVTTFRENRSNFYFEKPKDLSLKPNKIFKNIRKVENGFGIELSSKTLQKDVFYTQK